MLCFLQPKNFKELWFVFRSHESGEKAFYYYSNEQKAKENKTAYKGVLALTAVNCIQRHDPERKQQFLIEMTDGGMCFFEASSPYDAQEWVTCLNAVIFGKGPSGGECVWEGGVWR